MLQLQNARFVASVTDLSALPRDGRPQVVFAGRSNVGKSSLINRLLNRKNLARVGSAPGKTTHINFFDIDRRLWFVDLPGYGYAKVSKEERMRWGRLLDRYFAGGSISFGVLVIDLRHAPTADDQMMAHWFIQSGIPFVVAGNKADKLKKSEISMSLERARETLQIGKGVNVIAFSAEKGDGREALWREIINIMGVDAK